MIGENSAKKVLVLGIDAMDPALTRKFIDEGVMPNTKKFLEMGAARQDLVMLGGHPGITPPMWTTMATGCHSNVHGITCYSREVDDGLHNKLGYNFGSDSCRAEQIWNVTAEAGKKTLVFHWPGSSWPPSSDSENLHVVDGTQPQAINMGVAQVEYEFVLQANTKTPVTTFAPKSAADEHIPCVTTGLKITETSKAMDEFYSAMGKNQSAAGVETPAHLSIPLNAAEGTMRLSDMPYDVVLSTLKEAKGWANAPEDAMEFEFLFSQGFIRRPSLILKNEEGVYDRVAVYKSKKDVEPLYTLENDVYTVEVIDDSYYNDEYVKVNRNMRVLDIAPDGTSVKIWVSSGMRMDEKRLFSPQRLYDEVVDIAGQLPPSCNIGAGSEKMIVDCMLKNWEYTMEWQSKALHGLAEKEQYEVIFTHEHNLDAMGHMILHYMKNRENSKLPEEKYQEFMKKAYMDTDKYIGSFFDMIDDGWTVIIVSDHAQICPEGDTVFLTGNGLLADLGYAVLKKDENGNPIKEYDYSKSKAISNRSHAIYINLKGREPYGIVEPEDKWEVEEQLITDLYGLKDENGKRVISVALRNKDAVLLGLGGDYPQGADVYFWIAEGHNIDHGDSLATSVGYAGTSVSPIFMAAGPGIKKGVYTDRMIRQIDVVPTVAVLLGVRMPEQCEGAPAYQIME